MSAAELTVSLMPRILKQVEYPGSVADYAARWAAVISSRDPADLRPDDGRHASDPVARSSRTALRALQEADPADPPIDPEAFMAGLPARHLGDVLVGLAGEAAVRADLSEAEVACVHGVAPDVLMVPEAEIHARTGIGRTWDLAKVRTKPAMS